jgi:RND superfamily putative drug exporter
VAHLLYRLGRASARRAWLVIVAWIVILGVSGSAYLVAGGTLTSTFSIPGTPAQKVADELQASFPDADGGTGTIVFETESGEAFTAAQRAGVSETLERVADVAGVTSTVDPFVTDEQRTQQAQQLDDAVAQLAAASGQLDSQQALLAAGRAQLESTGLPATAPQFAALDEQQSQLDAGAKELATQRAQVDDGQRLLAAAENAGTLSSDGTIALGTVVFEQPSMSVTQEQKDAVIATVEAASTAGVTTFISSEIAQSIAGLLGAGEIVGVVIAAVVLLVMLGTIIAAGLPLVTAIIGVGIGAAATLSFSSVVEMSSVTPALGVMIGLAVGIDYSLFILNRHRRQLRDGVEMSESIGLANGTSGNAVLFAGLTVIIALVALNLTGIGFLGMMGTVAAVCVAVAVLIALTLTPALMALAGPRVLRKRERAAIAGTAARAVAPDATATARPSVVARHPVFTLLAGVIALLIVALPATTMRLGLPDGAVDEESSTTYQAYSAIERGFGAGANGPVIVVADLPQGADDAEVLTLQADIADRIMAIDHISAVVPVGVSEAGRTALFQVVPTEGPSSEETEEAVRDLRALSDELDDDLGVAVGVTGLTATNIDISKTLADALPLYLVVVLGLSIILMMLVFRSIAVPLIATGGFLLTVLATLGATVAVFQWGWLGFIFGVHDPAPILSFLPTILIGVVFGLAMDYQLFLVSGMREAYVHGRNAREAVNQGLRSARTVVIAAAIIMIAVFGGFAFSEMPMIRPIGFGLAIGVLVDAFVVRLLLVPAAMRLLGDAAWWLPRWLDRVMPDVDVEGASLERRHAVK